jgi:hypothetical protein
MSKKLTIIVSDEVYASLYRRLGQRKISRFIDQIAREHLESHNSPQYWSNASKRELTAAYTKQAAYEAAHAEELNKADED